MGAGAAFESAVRGYEPRELPHTLPGKFGEINVNNFYESKWWQTSVLRRALTVFSGALPLG